MSVCLSVCFHGPTFDGQVLRVLRTRLIIHLQAAALLNTELCFNV